MRRGRVEEASLAKGEVQAERCFGWETRCENIGKNLPTFDLNEIFQRLGELVIGILIFYALVSKNAGRSSDKSAYTIKVPKPDWKILAAGVLASPNPGGIWSITESPKTP